MIIPKKQICKLFFDYTKLIYRECGRPLSKAQEMKIKNKIDKTVKNYTLINKIKEALKKWKKQK